MVEIKQLVVKSNVVSAEGGTAASQTLSPDAREELLDALIQECRGMVIDLLRERKER